MAGNLVLRSLRKTLADLHGADEEKTLHDERAAESDRTIVANASDLSWLNNIPGLIKELQAEMGVQIPHEQVCSSEVTDYSAIELVGYLVELIADLQKSLQGDLGSEDLNSAYEYVVIDVKTAW